MNPETASFLFGRKPVIDHSALLTTEQIHKIEGNTGNTAFRAAITEQIVGLSRFQDYHDDPATAQDNEIGIIPASNHLGPQVDFKNRAASFARLQCRLVMIGLGAQSGVDKKIPHIEQGTIDWIREIQKRGQASAPNISVRGQFTLEVMQHYGIADQAVVLGCPSLFINPERDLGQVIAGRFGKIRRVAVAAGNEKWGPLRNVERSLARLVTDTGGSYVGQSSFNMYKITRGEARELDAAALEKCREYICPHLDTEQFIDWTERHGHLFFDIQSWMEHYRRFDFVIGARIHGVMLALQAGIPGVVIAHDSRTLELCETMMVPHVTARQVAGGITLGQLPDLFSFDARAFDQNRRMLAHRYVTFLEANGLMPVSWLRALADG
jgi:hypothetical protein